MFLIFPGSLLARVWLQMSGVDGSWLDVACFILDRQEPVLRLQDCICVMADLHSCEGY